MSTLNISLPSTMREFVEGQVARGGYSSSSEYVRALIRQEQQRSSQETLEAKLLAGIASGQGTEMTAKDWAELRQRVIRSKGRRRK